MKVPKVYVIMPVGKNDMSASLKQQKNHEVATRGFFYSVLARWLKP